MPCEDEETKGYGATRTTCGTSVKAAISCCSSLAKTGHRYYVFAVWRQDVVPFKYFGSVQRRNCRLQYSGQAGHALGFGYAGQLPERANMLLHSDQGSVYTSQAYQAAVKEKGITMSMSRKGTPADNAPIESFHSTLKSETFYLEDLRCTTTPIVERTVRDYITYYNSIRIQAKLNNQSPVDYRRLAA